MAEPITDTPIKTGLFGLGAVIVAAGAGYVMGMLLAPRSGRETRHMIGQKAERVKNAAKHRAEEAKTRIGQLVKAANKRADEMRESAERLADNATRQAQQAHR